MLLKGAKLIDFTGKAKGFEQIPNFCDQVVKILRNGSENKTVIVVDHGFHLPVPTPHVVQDHINLTGGNPLCGPNDACGERFPVVNDIYVTEFGGGALAGLPQGVAGGLVPGVVPTDDEMQRLRDLGVSFCCYNLVPTMLIAAHAGWRVLGLVLPEMDATMHEKLLSDLLANY